MSHQYDDIQARDTTDTRTAVQNKLAQKIRRQRYEESLDIEATVKSLIKQAENAIAGTANTDRTPEEICAELHLYLWLDEARTDVFRPNHPPDAATAVEWRTMHRRFTNGQYPDAARWLAVLADISKAMDINHAYSDLTDYVPVTMEHLDKKGARSSVKPDDVTPIGRLRLPHDSTIPPEEREPVIPHTACGHILTIALPRSGKDSTGASICGNLITQHRYKWISILDDGRNELPMIATPSDDEGIQQNLDQLGQHPRAYPCEVYVPAMEGLPDRLPANHVPFTIGIDDLTPELVLRLCGITSLNANTENRMGEAIEQTVKGSGTVEELSERLEEMAGEMEATIQVTTTELPEDVEDLDADDINEQVQEISYRMDEDEVLLDAASNVARLAGKGLIADVGTDTNLDMESILRDQATVAALSCNHLEDGNEAIRKTIMDLWMQLAYKARKANKRLPRVAMEIRELKNLAPSKIGDAAATKATKACRQTLYTISSQGSAERVLLVGSTQKLNEVYKPVRANMETKILLRLGDEQLYSLKDIYSFSDAQVQQLRDFDPGMGMLLRPDDRKYPIQWRGAPCGLGDGDRSWLDRYGIAWGARVRETKRDNWASRNDDIEWWVEVNDIEVRDGDTKPTVGDYYSEWHLLDRDFPDGTDPDDVDEALVEDVLEERREYPIPSDLSLQSTEHLKARRERIFRDPEEAREARLQERLEEQDVPTALHEWPEHNAEMRERMLTVLRWLDEHVAENYGAIVAGTGVSKSTISRYFSDDEKLELCVVEDEDLGGWTLTPIGEDALRVDWDAIILDEDA